MLRMLQRIICRDKRVKVYLEACLFILTETIF